MSYSVYTHTVLGFFIEKEKVNTVSKVRSCTHNVDLNAKFCSECGKSMFKEEVKTLLYEDEDLGVFQVKTVGGSNYYDYMVGISIPENKTNKDLVSVIGKNLLSSEEMEKVKVELMEELLAVGIKVNEVDFGFHFGLFHSY